MREIVVSCYGKGHFYTVTEALCAIDSNEQTTIRIKEGVYYEQIIVNKPNVSFIGEGKVILHYDRGARDLMEDGNEYGTFRTASTTIEANGFYADNITFKNSAGSGTIAGQALAIYIKADKVQFHHCRFEGWQDTIYTGNADEVLENHCGTGLEHRIYFHSCYIEGDVDYIFGGGTAFFDHCELYSLDRHEEAGRTNGYITAASTKEETRFGYVFLHCQITSAANKETVYLGRPWRDYANVAFISCEMGEHIKSEGFHNWGKEEREKTVRYAEYGTKSENNSDCRVPYVKQLSDEEAKQYHPLILKGNDNWEIYN